MDSSTALYAVVGGLAAVVFAVVLIVLVLRQPKGNAQMQEIAAAIQEGASAYLNRQYTVIAIIGAVIAVVIGVTLGWKTAALYVVGAALSAPASSRSSPGWAAASTPRRPTSARTWSARSRRVYPRTTHATRPLSPTTWATTSATARAWRPTSSRPTP